MIDKEASVAKGQREKKSSGVNGHANGSMDVDEEL